MYKRQHQLAALAQRAQPRWETEKLTEEFGEGIHSGATHTVWLLEEGDFTIDGPGADLVAAELNPQPLPPKLVLRPRADVSAKDTSCLLYTSPSPRDRTRSRMPSSA